MIIVFIGGITAVCAYSLEQYGEVHDISGCHLIYNKAGKYFNNDKYGNMCINPLQLFKLFNVILVS